MTSGKMLKRVFRRVGETILALMLFASFIFAAAFAGSPDNGIPDGYKPAIYNGIAAQQFKNVFETETIDVSGIKVEADSYRDIFHDTIHFRVFNSTTQETEYEIDTINDGGVQTLPDMKLKKNHNYIFFVEDPWYMLGTKKYVQILTADAEKANAGEGAYDYKTKDQNGEFNNVYNKLTKINVFKRDSECADPFADNRCDMNTIRVPVIANYEGEAKPGIKFRLVSDLETIETVTNSEGKLTAKLIEDVTYMVYIDSDKYVIDPFPIVAKDKSEYGEGRYCYNHSTCNRVSAINLYDPGEEDFEGYDQNSNPMSLKKRTSVSGMSFRHLLILDRELDRSIVSGMEDKYYDVIDITAVNPHRWEISKLCGTDFKFEHRIPDDTVVAGVYSLVNGSLKKLEFVQTKSGYVNFVMDSISLYPVVIEYDDASKLDIAEADITKVPDAVYSGKAISPKVTVTYKGTKLVEGTDYTVSVTNNVNAGNAGIEISGKGFFGGKKKVGFKINPLKINPSVKLSSTVYTYSGKVRTPAVSVKSGSQTLAAKYYDVTYQKGRKNVGTYTVSVKLKGNYSGSKSIKFKINPKGTVLSKVSPAAKKKMKVTWKKQTVQTTGYQIQYSMNASFKTACKIQTVNGYKKTSATIKNLKSKKKYYVRIRTYRTVKTSAGSTKYYSAWSKSRKVLVK